MQSNPQDPQSKPPRHWHGAPGNRHEHQNAWVIGQYQNYVPPRRDSMTISASPSASPSTSPVTTSFTNPFPDSDITPSAPIPIPDMAGPQDIARSSNGSPPLSGRRPSGFSRTGSPPTNLFSSLSDQKRNTTDPTMAARRQSYSEQMQKGGFLSKWWNTYTRGE